jgi:hypothetical protein
MVTWPKQPATWFSGFHSSTYRLAVLILVLFSLLPRVTFARASSPNPAPDAISEAPADFIIGPQASISSSWFDNTEVERGKFHGRNFPSTPPTGEAVDAYTLTHYYDLGLTLAIAYKRTGDPEFLTLFRKVCDSWWKLPGWIDEGRVRQFDVQGTAPKSAGIGGLILRAMDGRPEMWDWINAYTRYSLDLWLKIRINDPELYIGIREGAFALQYATWLAKVLPDSFPLQAGGTETNGEAIRAQYLADVEAISVNYYGRLQYPDGSWRWDDWYYTDSDGGQLRGVTQPFMVGLLLDALIDVHQITTNETVKTNIQNQITKSCRHLYSGGPYSTQRLSSLNVNLRGFHYFYHGGTTVNPTRYEKGDLPADWNPTNASDVQNQRQPIGLLVAAYGWSYQRTGDPFFKAAGDDLWDSAYGPTDGIRNYMAGDGKSYNQNCRWGGSYLVWAGTPSAPAPTPTPTPTPTSTPTPPPTVTPTPTPVPSGATASFVQLDTVTQGNWKSAYGTEGYNNVNDWMSYPSYAQVRIAGNTTPTWMASTTDIRAVQKVSSISRIAARLESSSSFTIDLSITDGQSHRVALYNLDWDGNNRSQRVDVVDWASNVILDTRTVSSFNGGKYLVWDIRGHVKISVTRTGAKTAVVSGLYFGAAANPIPGPSPTPTPTVGPGKSVGKAKRNGQNLSNEISADGTLDTATATATATANAPNTQTALQLFIADIDQAYAEFNQARSSYPRAAEIDLHLTYAKSCAMSANTAASNGNLTTLQLELRKSIDHLALSSVLIEQPELNNPIDAPSYMVRQNYLDFLNREPDAGGEEFWTGNITVCGTNAQCNQVRRVNVSAAFFLSIEFKETGYYVYRLYKSSYGRFPTMAEFMPDTIAISRGVIVGTDGWTESLTANKQQFVAAWMQRPAFQSLYGGLTNAQFVDSLIAKLGVTVTFAERNAMVQSLANGTSRATVLEQLATNPAFSQKEISPAFVLMEYFGYLRRDPDSGGFNFWLDKLNQAGGDYQKAEMVRAFLESIEYRERFRF